MGVEESGGLGLGGERGEVEREPAGVWGCTGGGQGAAAAEEPEHLCADLAGGTDEEGSGGGGHWGRASDVWEWVG